MDGEDQGTPERYPDDDWLPDTDPEVGLRGWIPPDDRLWRHPSESRGLVDGHQSGIAPPPGAHRPRSTPWVIGSATLCFVLVLVAAGVMISTTGGADRSTSTSFQSLTVPSPSPTTEPGAEGVPSSATVKAMIADLAPSTVAITSTDASGTTTSAGLVIAAGGIIVTTSSAVARARSLTVVESSGRRQPATVIGADQASGLTLLSIDDDLPAAVPDGADPTPGTTAVAMSLEPARSPGGWPTMRVYAGQVVASGRTENADSQTAAFTTTAIQAPLPPDDVGCPLVDAQGHVTGLLEAVTSPDGSALSVFLPAQLVFGVAEQLLRFSQVVHGSMGVAATDAQPAVITATSSVSDPVATGARVLAVDDDGPAASSGLTAGDVITAVDGDPVHSVPELETRLYADAPGTGVSITYRRGGTVATVAVVLGTGDADAPAVTASP